MHINIKNQVYNNYDNLIKQDKIETKKILINGKKWFILLDMLTVSR